MLTRSEAASLCLLSRPEPESERDDGPGRLPEGTTGVPGIEVGESRALSMPLRLRLLGPRMRDSTRSSTSLRATIVGPVDLSKLRVSKEHECKRTECLYGYTHF